MPIGLSLLSQFGHFLGDLVTDQGALGEDVTAIETTSSRLIGDIGGQLYGGINNLFVGGAQDSAINFYANAFYGRSQEFNSTSAFPTFAALHSAQLANTANNAELNRQLFLFGGSAILGGAGLGLGAVYGAGALAFASNAGQGALTFANTAGLQVAVGAPLAVPAGRVLIGAVNTYYTGADPFGAVPPLAAGAEGAAFAAESGAFATTEGVAVSGSRAIDLGASYETGIQGLYPGTSLEAQRFTAIVNGEPVSGVADAVAEINGQNTAIEAKFVDNWATSLRNPNSPIGQTPFAIQEQQAVVSQAANYSAAFEGGVVYHTNSVEFANYYSNAFTNAGITNFKFVITPAIR